ncbi:MAG TPA: adenylate cyclase, partial [Microbacterium sp.]|nr:adenylate cyclase [Microbacterium sp.]
MTEPRRTNEVEVKFDVEVDIAVPDWTRVPGVATVGA